MLPCVKFIINDGRLQIKIFIIKRSIHCFMKYKYNGYAQPICNIYRILQVNGS